MSKKIIFYGGCQGINKSERLKDAIGIINTEERREFYETIKLSEYFERYITANRGNNRNIKTLWHETDWKKHEEKIISEIIKKVQKEDKINIINNHFSVPYMGKNNYAPGLDQHNLEAFLYQTLFCDKGREGKKMMDIKAPCFGLLLIDPDPMLIDKHYKDMYNSINDNNDGAIKNILGYLNTILNYLSEDEIKKDLEQNRIWAKSYCDTASSVLGKKYVEYETIYITKAMIENGNDEINTKIATFLKKFID
jgi:hypothetical protein